MANGLIAYSTANFRDKVREVNVNIRKAENGYIFDLRGEKENPRTVKKDMYIDRWERFEATFVYSDLNDGLKEVGGFFELIEKMLKPKK